MLFFQVLLLLGYAYSHFMMQYRSPRFQSYLHIALILLSLIFLPLAANADWRPTGTENPTIRILALLTVSIGLPYFVLSTTGPLIQAWFDHIVDAVVPRASIPTYLADVAGLASASGSLIVGCGHAGDGNVHLSVFQPDPDVRHRVVHDVLAAAVALGGAVSGEHGIGTAKLAAYAELEDPVKLGLMRRIKAAFDPHGILNPGTVFSYPPTTSRGA